MPVDQLEFQVAIPFLVQLGYSKFKIVPELIDTVLAKSQRMKAYQEVEMFPAITQHPVLSNLPARMQLQHSDDMKEQT